MMKAMAKNLRVRDRLLLSLALVGDLGFDIWKGGTYLRKFKTLNFWTQPGYKPSNFRHAVWRMQKTDYIERIIKNGQPYIRITTYGKKMLARDFPLLNWQRKKWNKKWCLVLFDISEKERRIRKSLRWKLKRLGFGQWQRSVYLSPYNFQEDMVEFLKSCHLIGDAFVVNFYHNKIMGNPQDLAEKIWQINELNEKYEDIYYRLDNLKNKEEAGQLKEDFLFLINKDPFLPKALLPNIWFGDKVVKKINKFI